MSSFKKQFNEYTNEEEIVGPVRVLQEPRSEPLTNSNGTKYWIIPSVAFPGPGGEEVKCSASIWDSNYKTVLEKGGFSIGENYFATFRTYNGKVYIQVAPFMAGEGLLDESMLEGILDSINEGSNLMPVARPALAVGDAEMDAQETEDYQPEPEADLPF